MKPFTEFRPGILEETVINKVDVKTNLLTEKVMYLAMCCKIIYNNNFYFYLFFILFFNKIIISLASYQNVHQRYDVIFTSQVYGKRYSAVKKGKCQRGCCFKRSQN